MTIFSIQERFGHSLRGWLAFCGVAALGVGSTLASAADAKVGGPASVSVPANWAVPNASVAPTKKGSKAKADESVINHDGNAFRVVNSATVRTAADKDNNSRVAQASGREVPSVFDRPSQVMPVTYNTGCTSCGTSACGGACGTGHSSYSGYDMGYGTSCGTPCDPYRYVIVEGLFMQRTGNEQLSLSPNFRLDEFEYEWAPRITFGSVPDCAHGMEVSFVGVYEWDMAAGLPDAGGGIQTLLVPGLPVAAADLTAFTNATIQTQTYDAEFWGFEVSRTLIGWKMAKILYGFRYMDYDEEYTYSSANPGANRAGLYRSSTENQLFGFQIGADLSYPISCHGYTDIRARAGAYLNLADVDFRLTNNAVNVISNSADDEELAGFFEFGTGVRYELGEALTIRGGVEFWYLTGVATAPGQMSTVVTPNLGRNIDIDSDIFFLGLSAGAELKF